MSRARDNANLGAQAGSGLDASDITSGALGASVTGGAGLGVSTAATTAFAPKASPTFTGTVAIPNVANLETAVVANTAKVTNYNQTLADINALDVTELGTVTSANLSNTAIVYPSGHVIQTKVKSIPLASSSNTFCTTAAVGAVINTNSQNLEVTGFSAASGNHILVNYSCGSTDSTSSGSNALLGVIIDGTKYANVMCNTLQLVNATVTFAHTLGSSLSNATISAWLFAANSNNKCVYQHNYTSSGNMVWTISVQEIQA